MTYHREDCGKHLDDFALVGNLVVPVKHHAGLADHKHKVGLRICLTKAVVWTSAEYEPVLGLLISVASNPSLRLKRVGVGVCFGVVQCWVGCRNDHRALLSGVFGCDREVLLGEVGNHDDWGTVAECLLHDSAGPLELLDRVEGQRCVDVTVAGLQVLFADLVEELGSVSHDLEEPGGGRRGSVLGGEKEGEDGHGDFEVAEPADNGSRLLGVFDLLASLNPLTVLLGLDHVVDPEVENALLLATSSHANLGLCGASGELLEDHIGSLLSVPALGKGQNDGEVDELEGGGNQVVVVSDLLDGLIRAVVADKGPAAHSGDQLAELLHPRDVLALVLDLREVHPLLEVVVVDLLLSRQILLERLAGEEAVETLAVIYVSAAVEEDPVLGAEELVGGIDDAGLDECGRVEDLAGHVAG